MNVYQRAADKVHSFGPIGLAKYLIRHSKKTAGLETAPIKKYIGFATGPSIPEVESNGRILFPSDSGWDSCRVEDPTIIYAENKYYMIYAGSSISEPNRTCLGLAVSDDGSKWRRLRDDPVLTTGEEGAWDDYAIKNPAILERDGKYHLIYDGGNEEDGSWSGLGHATSTDLISWKRDSSNPILQRGEAGSWDCGHVADGYLMDHGDSVYLFYAGHDGNEWSIGFATSFDLGTWTKHPENPIFTTDDNPYRDDNNVNDPAVTYRDGVYHMVYKGSTGTLDGNPGFGRRLEYATSPDLKSWKHHKVPILAPTERDSWDGSGITNPDYMRTDDGVFLVYVGREPPIRNSL